MYLKQVATVSINHSLQKRKAITNGTAGIQYAGI